MKISFQPNYDNKFSLQQNRTQKERTTNSPSKNYESKNISSFSADTIKANFCPTFGRFRLVDRVLLQNKNTMFLEPANIVKENYGQTSVFKAMVNKKEAGYMHLKFDAIIPERDFLVMESDNNIPEVTHLRSILGEDYSGIGTCLLHTAVQESKKYGRNGALWLNAETGYAYQLSKHRSNQSPIPFYYKLGFISPDEKIHNQILKCLENGQYNYLPSDVILLLPSDRVHILEDYYSKHFEMD